MYRTVNVQIVPPEFVQTAPVIEEAPKRVIPKPSSMTSEAKLKNPSVVTVTFPEAEKVAKPKAEKIVEVAQSDLALLLNVQLVLGTGDINGYDVFRQCGKDEMKAVRTHGVQITQRKFNIDEAVKRLST